MRRKPLPSTTAGKAILRGSVFCPRQHLYPFSGEECAARFKKRAGHDKVLVFFEGFIFGLFFSVHQY